MGKLLKKISANNLFDNVYVIFSNFLYKNICCGYSFKLHRQVGAIQMGPTTYAFIKKKTKSKLAVIWRLRNCLIVRL